MKRINILDSSISNLIAAGEIVYDPSCVVKELIENSIDAAAKRISIEITSGGTKMIKVSDDGHGIYRDDIIDAFKCHATSKIQKIDQINKISSLGFRGEALHCISRVSKIEVKTKTSEENIGTHLKIVGGTFGKISDIGAKIGTTICVNDLFYNTPARMKFLKKESIESAKISSLIDKLSLSHPEIFFKFIKDGKVSFCSAGDGKISSALYCVFGKDYFDGSMKINFKAENLKISGFVSKPENARPGKKIQIFFVNGRYVKCKLISNALEDAFKNYMMVGKSPYCVFYIEVPFDSVDVNVHPAKTEIKFSNEQKISDAIYKCVKETIEFENVKKLEKYVAPFKNIKKEKTYYENINDNSMVLNDSAELFSDDSKINLNFENYKKLIYPKEKENIQNETFDTIELKEKSDLIGPPKEVFMNKSLRKNFKLIGEIFSCYIILQCKDSIIIVDKHAAHERIIFEKIRNKAKYYDSQILIKPICVSLEKQEYVVAIENKELFSKSGYEIEDFGEGNIIVRSAPMYEQYDQIKNSIIEISNYISNNRKTTETKKLDWIYQNIACKSAIKAKAKTSIEEIAKLIQDLINNPKIAYCPHGRPIYIIVNKNSIEKRFKRL